MNFIKIGNDLHDEIVSPDVAEKLNEAALVELYKLLRQAEWIVIVSVQIVFNERFTWYPLDVFLNEGIMTYQEVDLVR